MDSSSSSGGIESNRHCIICQLQSNLTRHHIVHKVDMRDQRLRINKSIHTSSHGNKQKFFRRNMVDMCETCHQIVHNILNIPSGEHPSNFTQQILQHRN